MARRHLSRSEVIKVHEIFKQHLIPSGKEGLFKYQDDWDDAKVAQQIDTAIQATAMGNLRVELFGKLDTGANAAREDSKRLDELNARIIDQELLSKNLLECYQVLELKYNTLVETLALNKVVPTAIKHLKTTHKE